VQFVLRTINIESRLMSSQPTGGPEVPWLRMLLVFLLIGGGAVGVFMQQRGRPPAKSVQVGFKKLYDCAQDAPLPAAERTPLVEATDALKLDFSHAVGPLGTYYFPESVGSGGALCDFDNDGFLDLFLVNSGRSPEAIGEFAPDVRVESRLYRMQDGKFVDVSADSGLEHLGYGMGCAAGDVDNDGDNDLYVTTVGQDRLFLNQGNMKFVDVTAAAGLSNAEWGTGASWLDYDRDGRLDLVVVNYARDDVYDFSVACGARQGYVSYCGPNRFSPTIDRLYHNDGMQQRPEDSQPIPRFSDVTEASGISQANTYGMAAVCADLTGDGWVDIYVANDAHPNRLWVNQQDGRFEDEAMARGVAVNGVGYSEGSMGLVVVDFDRDLSLDLVVTNLSGESTTLYLNDGAGYFQDRTDAVGLVVPSRRHTGWGAAMVDLDHDGDLDLPLVNGLVIPCHSGFPPHGEDRFQVAREEIKDSVAFWRDYHDRNKLLTMDKPGQFRDDTVDLGGDFTRAMGSGRSLIYGDPDEDGDIDLIVTNTGSRTHYYRNEFPKRGHWLRLRVLDPRWNRDAFGAKVTIEASGQAWTNVVLPASSYLASNDVRVHFGLGAVTSIDRIIVHWPDGPVESSVEEFECAEVDADVIIERGQGKLLKEDP